MDETSRAPVTSLPKRKSIGLAFKVTDPDDGYSTTDIFQGLLGVLRALDHDVGAGSFDEDTIRKLCVAGHVLASKLDSLEG